MRISSLLQAAYSGSLTDRYVSCLSSSNHRWVNLFRESLPHRSHGLTPRRFFLIGQRDDLDIILIDNRLPVPIRLFESLRFDLISHLRQDCFQFMANVSGQFLPEGLVGDDHVAKETVVGFSYVGLQGLETLGINIAPGVFLSLDQFPAQGVPDFGKREFDRDGP